jgi:hypothetical protein
MALQQRDPVEAQQTFWKLLPRRLLESQAEACGKNDRSHSISRERFKGLLALLIGHSKWLARGARRRPGEPKMATISELRTDCRPAGPLLAIDGISLKNVVILIEIDADPAVSADETVCCVFSKWEARVS